MPFGREIRFACEMRFAREKIRMTSASQLLTYTDQSVETIADIFSYSCAASFRRASKEYYGITPGQYRKNARSAKRTRNNPGPRIRSWIRLLTDFIDLFLLERGTGRKYARGLPALFLFDLGKMKALRAVISHSAHSEASRTACRARKSCTTGSRPRSGGRGGRRRTPRSDARG